MTKQEFWSIVYIEAMRQGRMNNPKELADKAVDDFEKRFDSKETIEWRSPSFTQAGRLKRLFEEMEVEIFCSNDEENSSILICGTELKFYFTNGEFENFEK